MTDDTTNTNANLQVKEAALKAKIAALEAECERLQVQVAAQKEVAAAFAEEERLRVEMAALAAKMTAADGVTSQKIKALQSVTPTGVDPRFDARIEQLLLFHAAVANWVTALTNAVNARLNGVTEQKNHYRLGTYIIAMDDSGEGSWASYWDLSPGESGISRLIGKATVDKENDVLWLSSWKVRDSAEGWVKTLADVEANRALLPQWTSTRWAVELTMFDLFKEVGLLDCRTGREPSKGDPEAAAFWARLKQQRPDEYERDRARNLAYPTGEFASDGFQQPTKGCR